MIVKIDYKKKKANPFIQKKIYDDKIVKKLIKKKKPVCLVGTAIINADVNPICCYDG